MRAKLDPWFARWDESQFGRAAKMKILLAFETLREAEALKSGLTSLGHELLLCSELNDATHLISTWQPELLVGEERLGRKHPDAGVRLAGFCRMVTEQSAAHISTQVLVVASFLDWDRIKQLKRAGAHVVVKTPNFDAVVRYVQTVTDQLVTDRILGPVLVGLHRFRGSAPGPFCDGCDWLGASVSYGTSNADLHLTPVRTALLNALLFHRRGQSTAAIADLVDQRPFLWNFLEGRALRATAIKMEITRLRCDIGDALDRIGAPYQGNHFLPLVPHGVGRYRLEGNFQLTHAPVLTTQDTVSQLCRHA